MSRSASVSSLALGSGSQRHLVLLQVHMDRTIVLNGQAALPEPGSTAQVSTLVYQCLHGPVLALWMALVWPLVNWRRLAGAALASAVLRLMDLPIKLAGEVWQVVVDSLQPTEVARRPNGS